MNESIEVLTKEAEKAIGKAAQTVRELSASRLRLKMSTNRTNNIARELEDLAKALNVRDVRHRI